jgi:hypothetical protein
MLNFFQGGEEPERRLLVDEFAKQAALEEHIGWNRIGSHRLLNHSNCPHWNCVFGYNYELECDREALGVDCANKILERHANGDR